MGEKPQTTASDSGPDANRRNALLRRSTAVVIGVITFLAFLPALSGDWLNWDDDENFLENAHFRGLSPDHLGWMLTTFHMGPYQPLSWMTLGADYLVWGMRPFGYHLTNLLLHCANAILFFFLGLRLLRFARAWHASERPDPRVLVLAAAFGALVFAVHPLRVESVAWITERRDVLNGFFVLLTLLVYTRACEAGRSVRERRRGRVIAWIWYVCSLLAKASSMTLPAVLLVVDVYPLRRLSGKTGGDRLRSLIGLAVEKAPYIVVAVFAAVAAAIGQKTRAGLVDMGAFSAASRLAVAAYASAFYVWKTILPVGLSPLYELDVTLDPFQSTHLLCAALVVAVTVVLIRLRRRAPAILAAWLAYLLLTAPVSGLAQAGPQIAADRYSYLPCMGFALLAAGALMRACVERSGRIASPRRLATAGIVCTAVVGTLFAFTWRQTTFWRSSHALWTRALAIDEDCVTAHLDLADAYQKEGDLDQAVSHYRRCIELRPGYAKGFSGLGAALCAKGQLATGVAAIEHAIELQPDLAVAHNNLGNAYRSTGDVARAAACYRKAVELDPDYANAHYNLGNLHVRAGRSEEAAELYRRAVAADPDHVDAWFNLGNLRAGKGDIYGAAEAYRQVLRLTPNDAEARKRLDWCEKRMGRSAFGR